MWTLPRGQRSWSPMKAMAQWWRDWIRAGSALAELKCCGEDEVERLAKDLGMSASELRGLASRGPHSADLLLQRMAALDLNRNEVSRPSLERSRTFSAFARCARAVAGVRELARNAADPAWEDYCPNAATLMALNAMPWRARAEW